MSKKRNLKWQFRSSLISKESFGQSKHLDKVANHGKPAADKIYSYRTRDAYVACTDRFAAWCGERGIKTMDEAKDLVPEYIEGRIAAGLSAWTVHQDLAAISKSYSVTMSYWGVTLPPRLRGEVTKNRTPPPTWDDPSYADIRAAGLCCGLRQHELRLLRPEDVYTASDGQTYVHVRQGKGGRQRDAVCLDGTMSKLAAEAKAAGSSRIFQDVPKDSPCHYARRQYAKALYARVVAGLPPEKPQDKYVCREDMKGYTLDKRAMRVVTEALGHSRLDVVTVYLLD